MNERLKELEKDFIVEVRTGGALLLTPKMKDWPAEGDIFFRVSGAGDPLEISNVYTDYALRCIKLGNAFRTKEIAAKAAVLMAYSNNIIRACLEVDPEFVPDWGDADQTKWSVWYADKAGWQSGWYKTGKLQPAYVSTEEKAGEAIELLIKWGVK